MRDRRTDVVAIVDYGLGNLFSIQRACEHVGLLGKSHILKRRYWTLRR